MTVMNKFKVYYRPEMPPYKRIRNKRPWGLGMDGMVLYWFETLNQAMSIGRFLAANNMETGYTMETTPYASDYLVTETEIVHTYTRRVYQELGSWKES